MLLMQSSRFKCAAVKPRAVEVNNFYKLCIRPVCKILATLVTACKRLLLRVRRVGGERMSMEHGWGGGYDNGSIKRSIWRKSYACVTLSTTDPTWTGLGLIPGLHGARPARTHGRAIAFLRSLFLGMEAAFLRPGKH